MWADVNCYTRTGSPVESTSWLPMQIHCILYTYTSWHIYTQHPRARYIANLDRQHRRFCYSHRTSQIRCMMPASNLTSYMYTCHACTPCRSPSSISIKPSRTRHLELELIDRTCTISLYKDNSLSKLFPSRSSHAYPSPLHLELLNPDIDLSHSFLVSEGVNVRQLQGDPLCPFLFALLIYAGPLHVPKLFVLFRLDLSLVSL
jgi:hypothetical protein